MSKASAAKEELERLLDVAVKEYEDDFALKEQKEEAARAGMYHVVMMYADVCVDAAICQTLVTHAMLVPHR